MTTRAIAMTGWLLLLILLSAAPVGALNQPTHGVLNVQALMASTVHQTLVDRYGFEEGLGEFLAQRPVQEWIRRGGWEEDDPFCRSANHFHDPLKPWDSAGLIDPAGLAFACSPELPASLIPWMQRVRQDPTSTDACLPEPAWVPGGGTWSWPEARRCLLRALSSPSLPERERAWATVFRALGHVMHLVTDASVPEHVRNDAHIIGTAMNAVGMRKGNYEYWVAAQHGRGGLARFIASYLSNPVRPHEVVLQTIPIHSAAKVPIASLIDTDRYTGDPAVTLTGPIGIAEFANANFFSEDRIAGDFYPAPVLSRLEYRELRTQSGYVRGYYRKGQDDGLPVDPVAALCVLDGMRDLQGQPRAMPCTDALVWEQVARIMLPRAVGYSAALLNYFFRGEVDVRSEGSGIRLVNKTANDEAMSGLVSLYYDNATGVRAPLPGWEPQRVQLGAGGESQTLPTPVRPPDMAPGSRFMLVFEGQLGAEQDAVFGQLLSSNVLIALTDTGSCAREPFESLPECPSYGKEGPLTLSAQNGVVELPAAAHAKFDTVVTLGPRIDPSENPNGLYLNHVAHDHRQVYLEWREPLPPGTQVEVTVNAVLSPGAPPCYLYWGQRWTASPTLEEGTYDNRPVVFPAQSIQFSGSGRYTLPLGALATGFMLLLDSPPWYPYSVYFPAIPPPGVYPGSAECRLLLMRFVAP